MQFNGSVLLLQEAALDCDQPSSARSNSKRFLAAEFALLRFWFVPIMRAKESRVYNLRRTIVRKCGLIALMVVCIVAGLLAAGAAAPGAGKGAFTRTTIDIGVVVSDVEKSAKFYTEALGFTEAGGFDVSKEMGGDSGLTDYQPFGVKQLVLANEASATRVKLMDFPGVKSKKVNNKYINSSLGFSYLTIFVSDTTAAVERVKKAGVTPVKEPYQLGTSNNYLTLVKDPDGNIIELVGPKK